MNSRFMSCELWSSKAVLAASQKLYTVESTVEGFNLKFHSKEREFLIPKSICSYGSLGGPSLTVTVCQPLSVKLTVETDD